MIALTTGHFRVSESWAHALLAEIGGGAVGASSYKFPEGLAEGGKSPDNSMQRYWEGQGHREISDRKLNVGLLGCGRIASQVHLPILRALPSVRLAALAELDETSLSRAAAEADGVDSFYDWEQLLDGAEIDAAIITLPTSLHAEAAEAAFDRGLHVYTEKPLGVSCAATLNALRRWRESGKVGAIGFNFRFSPQFESTRELIAAGRIGEVLGTHTTLTSSGRALPDWKRRRQSGGGALLDLASHHFDLLPWLLDRSARSVSCVLNSVESEDDTSSVQLTLEGGVVSQIFTSIAGAEEHRLEIFGRDGTLVVDLNRSDRPEIRGPTLDKARLRKLSDAARAFSSPAYWGAKMKGQVREASFVRSLSSFSQAAIEGRQVNPNLNDGYRSLTIVEAAEESARRGCTIEISFTADEDLTG